MKTRVDCGTRPQNFRAGWGGLDYGRGERSPKQNILYAADSRLDNILADESNLFFFFLEEFFSLDLVSSEEG